MNPAFSSRVDTAVIVATLAHRNQERKGTEIPYIMHPVHVALLLQRAGYPDEVVVAGLLHDVLEDMEFGNRTLQEDLADTFRDAVLPVMANAHDFREAFVAFLDGTFGPEVMSLVRAVSEAKNDGEPSRPWAERKDEQYARFEAATDWRIFALKAADTLHNVQSVLRELRTATSLDVMRKFTAGPRETTEHYLRIARLVAERLGDHPLAAEAVAAAIELDKQVAMLMTSDL